jgi:hypothetical protein
MKRFGLVGITLWALLSLLDAPQAAAQQITVNVKLDGQAAPGVSVVFLAANVIKTQTAVTENADKSALSIGNIIKTRVAVTNASGTGILDLSNIIKPHGQVEVQIVVRICKDGKNVVYILQKGQEVPPQDKKCVDNKDCECKDRPVAGIFPINDGDTITVGINPETVDVQVTHTGVAPEKQIASGNTQVQPGPVTNSFKTIWFVAEGGAGQSWNPSAGCGGITQTLKKDGFDQVACTTNARDIAYIIDGQVRFLRFFGVSGGYMNDGSVTQKTTATISSVPGVVATVNGFFGDVKGGTFQGLASLPFTDKFAVTLRGGLQAWNVRSGNTSALVVPGLPTMTTPFAQKNSGVNPLIGATLEFWVTRFFGFDVTYAYARYTDGSSVNEKDHKLLFGVLFSLRRPVHGRAFWKH